MALIFDIETVGEEWDSFDEATQGQLTRWLSREARDEDEYQRGLEDLKNGLGFSPLTGSIVAIGVYDSDQEKGAVYFSAPGANLSDSEEGNITYRPMEEKLMLEQFWKVAAVCTEFVSFNGRCFDAPFLAIRSAVHGVRPTRNLLEGRYLYQQRDAKHIDLLDQFSFYGAVRRSGSLHMFCRAFGIESPKASGTTGDDVAALYTNKHYLAIARYNVGDLIATTELYRRWKRTLS